MFNYHSDMGHCFSLVVVVSEKSKKVKEKIFFFFFFFYFSELGKADMALGKGWLFQLGMIFFFFFFFTFLNWEKQTWYWERGGYFQLGMGPNFGPKRRAENALLYHSHTQLHVVIIILA